MITLIMGDFHLEPELISIRDDGSLCVPFLEKLSEIILEINPDCLLILGDIFDNKDHLSAAIIRIYKEFLIRHSNKKIIHIVGNHDYSVKAGFDKYHALDMFRFIPNVSIVDSYAEFDDFKDCAFVSYCRTREDFDLIKDKLINKKVIFGHFDISGFLPGDDKVESPYFLSPESFDSQLIISGHYHEPQEKTFPTKNVKIIFVGSQYTTTFGESDQEKRVLLYDSNNFSYKSFPTNMTKHKTIKIYAKDKLPEISEDDIKNGVKYRIQIHGTKEDIDSMNIPKEYRDKVKIDVRIEQNDQTRINVSVTDSKESVLKEYMKEDLKKYTNQSFDESKLLEIGLEILKQQEKD